MDVTRGGNENNGLIIGVLKSPAGAKNRHDDYSLAKICLVAKTESTGRPAF